jgi:formate hydrogenlyase subunit 6/NADH:ubiquinone oxidoreductase subunit I
MEQTGWRLAESELRAWLDQLRGEGKRIVAPVDRDGLRLFRAVKSASEIDLSPGKTRWSPKEFLFPRTESLYTYTLRAEGPELRDPTLPEQQQVLVGVRSCDAAGLVRLDEIFLRGGVQDPLYARRRELTTVVAFACSEAEPECFCTAVGGSPMGTDGVDLLFLPFGADWLLRPETDKGRALVTNGWARAAREHWSLAAEEVRRVGHQISRTPVAKEIAATIEGEFDSPVWEEIARRCLSCSVCAYVCPSCSCFDVHHEGNAWGGREFRSWDACTFPLFTLHASGHNPRGGPDARYRQRVLHKFAYSTPEHREAIRCVGCGRCIDLCPAGIDIHDAVCRLTAHPRKGNADV